MTKPKVEVLPIAQGATPDLNNVNKHTQKGGKLLGNSLRKRGAFRSIASAGKGVEIPVVGAGNFTLENAVDAGFTEIINVHVTGNQLVNVVRDDIEPNSPEFYALAIEDNEIGKQSYNPDIDILAALSAGDSAVLSALRSEDKVFGGMLEDMGVYANEPMDAEPQIDRAAELLEKWQVKAGDLWQIGEHRLLCGDSTKREDVERLMGGERADFTVTSPPYFNMRDYSFFETYEDYLLFVEKIIVEILNIANPKSFALMWNVSTDILHSKDIPADTSVLLQKLGMKFCGDICWVKSGSSSSSMRSNHIITNQHYYPLLKHEPIKIFSMGKYPAFDKKDTEYVNNILGDVWEITQVLGSEQKKIGHNAPFPLELANRCVLSMSKNGAIVYEPFGGSGTTMLVCENTGRQNRSMDYNPKYCAVILERMATAFPDIEIKRQE